MANKPQSTDTSRLSAIELESRVSVPKAAAIKGISEDTFRRHYAHLIEQASPRRQVVKLKHVIA